MKPHSILLKICLAISTVCLGAGYLASGYWQILLVFPVLALIWFFVVKYSVFWSAAIFLVITISLAAMGILAGFPLFLMLVAGTTALASWELLQFNPKQVEIHPLLERNHLKTLGLATGTGLVLALIVSGFSLEIPFVVTSILALILFGGFLWGVRI